MNGLPQFRSLWANVNERWTDKLLSGLSLKFPAKPSSPPTMLSLVWFVAFIAWVFLLLWWAT